MIKGAGISDEQARQILKRAAEIDRAAAEVISVETLRAAAHEAGIAPSSFDAALNEHAREEVRDDARLSRRRLLIGACVVVATAVLLQFGLMVVPNASSGLPPDTPLTARRR